MAAFRFYVDPADKIRALSMTVLLARHGTHDEVGRVLSGRTEIALNEAGLDQAERLASRLAGAPLAKVFTSPRRRALETARVVAARTRVEPIAIDALDEIDFGEWTGRSFTELEGDARWRFWNNARGRAATPAGETMATVTSRVLRHLDACGDDGAILCVSHCDIIRGVVANYLGLHPDRLLAFDIDPASITTIELDQGSARVVAINERVS